ncbi:MAG TPA: ABC transporter permease [Longimicrobium sp.]|nr:ABC transporter permease [Longimicrobium sp.]
MSEIRQLLAGSELRFAARRLRRAPGFAAAVILVLALGIGTTTAVFSLVNGILLEPLPYPEPDRLARLTHTVGDAGREPVDLSDAMVLLYQDQARAFDGVAAWRFDDGDLAPSEAGQDAIRVRGSRVTANFFDVLGVRPALGRTFEPGEDRPGKNGVVVLSHRIWRERLRGDPDAIGRQIVVNDVPRTIVGIMPPRFGYPAHHVELWLPLSIDPARTKPATLNLAGIGRLRRDVSPGAARADLARVLTHAGDQGGAPPAAGVTPHVRSLRDSIVGPISHLLWFVFASVLLVLLAACANVAGLLLVRAERAQRELAVRAALGSGFMGMAALTLSESVLLSVLGGGAGVLLAAAAMRVVPGVGTALSLPRLEDVGIDAPVLLFAVGITVLCALLVSVLPLLRARRVSIAQTLRSASVGTGPAGGRSPRRVRDALVVAQIALAVVLVAVSGLMTRSFLRLLEVRPGFEADGVVTSRVLLPYARYGAAESRLNFFEALAREARAIPGTRDVALTDRVPLGGDGHDMAIEVEDDRARANAGGAEHAVAHVDGPYFQALRIPLRGGRTFGPQDAARPSDEAIVSRAFAERYWPGESPLGRRVRPIGGRWHTIVGEVGDVHYDGLEEPANALVYFPVVTARTPGADASLPAALSLVVRTEAREGETLAAIRRIVRSLDPTIPTFDEGSLNGLVHDASARARALVVLLALASIMTSLLGAVGLYGIMAYSVSIRRRELGIRMALGARPEEVSRMVSLDGLRLAGLGIVIGTACALAASRLLRGLLYGAGPADLLTLGVTPVAILAVAFVASWIPARRAAAVPPAEALGSQ